MITASLGIKERRWKPCCGTSALTTPSSRPSPTSLSCKGESCLVGSQWYLVFALLLLNLALLLPVLLSRFETLTRAGLVGEMQSVVVSAGLFGTLAYVLIALLDVAILPPRPWETVVAWAWLGACASSFVCLHYLPSLRHDFGPTLSLGPSLRVYPLRFDTAFLSWTAFSLVAEELRQQQDPREASKASSVEARRDEARRQVFLPALKSESSSSSTTQVWVDGSPSTSSYYSSSSVAYNSTASSQACPSSSSSSASISSTPRGARGSSSQHSPSTSSAEAGGAPGGAINASSVLSALSTMSALPLEQILLTESQQKVLRAVARSVQLEHLVDFLAVVVPFMAENPAGGSSNPSPSRNLLLSPPPTPLP